MKNMPVIQVYALGGTIAMTPDASSGVTPSLDANALISAVPGLSDIADIRAENVAAIGSANISIKMIQSLCEMIKRSDADGFVITQGTDTMEESSFIASLLYSGSKPIVFTGAMRAAMQPGADGPNNLYNAVLVAGSYHAPRVSVVMNGEIHDPWHVAKEHTVALSAFVSEYAGPIGYVIEQKVQIRSAPTSIESALTVASIIPNVLTVTAGLEVDVNLLRNIEKLGYQGVVVEALGAGHVSEDWADALGELAQRIPVLLATRASCGPVLESSYGYKGAEIDLISRGLLPCGALKGRKARLLLMVLLSSQPEDWKANFLKLVKEL
ncbi:MAG: asparaginase [Kordiimonas sp.]